MTAENNTIMGPVGNPVKYEMKIPPTVIIKVRRVAVTIIRLRVLLKSLAVAAGIVSKAITRIIPTTFISITTAREIITNKIVNIAKTGMFFVLANSSSNKTVRNELYKKTVINIIMISVTKRSIRSKEFTSKMFPNRNVKRSVA